MEQFKYILSTQPAQCNKGLVGGPVDKEVDVAFPVRSNMEPLVSALIFKELSVLQELLREAEAAMESPGSRRVPRVGHASLT